MEDTDEAVAELAECGAVADASGSELVVVGASAWGGAQRGEGLLAEGVDQPVVVDVAG